MKKIESEEGIVEIDKREWIQRAGAHQSVLAEGVHNS